MTAILGTYRVTVTAKMEAFERIVDFINEDRGGRPGREDLATIMMTDTASTTTAGDATAGDADKRLLAIDRSGRCISKKEKSQGVAHINGKSEDVITSYTEATY